MANQAGHGDFPLDAEVGRAYSEWHIFLMLHQRELEQVTAVVPDPPAPDPVSESQDDQADTADTNEEDEVTLESLGLA